MTRSEAIQRIKELSHLHAEYPDVLRQSLESALGETHEVEAQSVLKFALSRVYQALTTLSDIDRTLERKREERERLLRQLPMSLLDKRFREAPAKTDAQIALLARIAASRRAK